MRIITGLAFFCFSLSAQITWQNGPSQIFGASPCPDGRWAVMRGAAAVQAPSIAFWNPKNNTFTPVPVAIPSGYALRGNAGNRFIIPPFDSQTLICSAGNTIHVILYPSGMLNDFQAGTALARISPGGPTELLISTSADPATFLTTTGSRPLFLRNILGMVSRGSLLLAELYITPSPNTITGALYAFADINTLKQTNTTLHESSSLNFLPCLTQNALWFVDYTNPSTFMGNFVRFGNGQAKAAFSSVVKIPNRSGDQWSNTYACNGASAAIGYSVGSTYYIDRFDDQLRSTRLLQTTDILADVGGMSMAEDGSILYTGGLGANLYFIGADGKAATVLNAQFEVAVGTYFPTVLENRGIFGALVESDVRMGNRIESLLLAHVPKLAKTFSAATGQSQFFAACQDCYGTATATVGGKSASVTPISDGFAIQIPAGLALGSYPVSITLAGDLKKTVLLTGTLLLADAAGPSFGRLAVTNASSGELADLAPGEWITIYGQRLSALPVSAGSLPFPDILGGTQVLLNGQPLPLWYVGPGQINALLPSDLSGSSATLQVVSAGAKSDLVTVAVADVSPGLSTYNGGETILTSPHGLISQTNPLLDGDEVTFYGTGFGATNPQIPSNMPAPDNPLARTTGQVTVTFGVADSLVRFAGLSPGSFSLFQMNVRVSLPAKQNSGPQRLQGTVSIGGATAKIVTWY